MLGQTSDGLSTWGHRACKCLLSLVVRWKEISKMWTFRFLSHRQLSFKTIKSRKARRLNSWKMDKERCQDADYLTTYCDIVVMMIPRWYMLIKKPGQWAWGTIIITGPAERAIRKYNKVRMIWSFDDKLVMWWYVPSCTVMMWWYHDDDKPLRITLEMWSLGHQLLLKESGKLVMIICWITSWMINTNTHNAMVLKKQIVCWYDEDKPSSAKAFYKNVGR